MPSLSSRTSAVAALAAIALIVGGMSPASATLVTHELTWSYTAQGQGIAGTSISGSTSFVFDTALVTGATTEQFQNLPLLTFAQNPNNVSAVPFSTANMGASLVYNSGNLSIIQVGATIAGINGVFYAVDDLYLEFEPVGGVFGLDRVLFSRTGFGGAGIGEDLVGNLTISSVPEPSSVFAFGLLGAACCSIARHRR